MSRNSVPSPKTFESEELKNLLTKTLHRSAFSVDSYLVDGKVVCHGKYYDYRLISSGNEIKIHPKWNQTWFLCVLGCAIFGLFLILPFIGVAVLSMLGNSEYSDFKRVLKDSVYNDSNYQKETNQNGADPLDQLQKLAELKEKGLISDVDYENKKAMLLEKMK